MKKTIPSWKAYEYVEVFEITEYRDGMVFKTKSIGFAHRERPMKKNERYASISTRFFRNKDNFELELID